MLEDELRILKESCAIVLFEKPEECFCGVYPREGWWCVCG